ncbi:MAG: O-antigen ligase family protein [Vicinamibacterales bacterium]
MRERQPARVDSWDRLAMAGLLASVVAIPVTRSVTLPIVGPRVTVFELVAMPSILLWLAARTVSRSWSSVVIWKPLDLALAAFWAVAALSGITAYRTLGTIALIPFLTELVVLSYLLLFFVMSRDLIVRRRALGALFDAWAVAALVVGVFGLVGIAEMLRCSPPMSSLVYGNGRLLSTFRNPNQVAAYMVPTVMVFTALCASRPVSTLSRLFFPAAVLSVTVLYFCASRGGAIAVTVGWLILIGLQQWASLLRVVVTLGVSVALLAGSTLVIKAGGNTCFAYVGNTVTTLTVQLPLAIRLARTILGQASPGGHVRGSSELAGRRSDVLEGAKTRQGDTIPRGSDTATSFAFRGVMARIALRFALEHPFTGIGLGTMHVHVQAETKQQADVDAHNMGMTVLAETGFVGLTLFAWSLAYLAWTAFTAFRRTDEPAIRALRAGLLAALLAYLVMTLSFDGQRQRVLWMLMAVIVASLHESAFTLGGLRVPAERTSEVGVGSPASPSVV